jgi:hypothetical protein
MTAMNDLRVQSPPPARDPSLHLYAVGEMVRLKGGFGISADAGSVYRITGTLPARGDSPQYRIRSDDERHERVATQDTLAPVGKTGGGHTLLEKTFGASPAPAPAARPLRVRKPSTK